MPSAADNLEEEEEGEANKKPEVITSGFLDVGR